MNEETIGALIENATLFGVLLTWIYYLRQDLKEERKYWRDVVIGKLNDVADDVKDIKN